MTTYNPNLIASTTTSALNVRILHLFGASRAQTAQEGVVEGAAEAATERPQRAPRKCSMCYSIKHNVRTCPRRQATS